MITVTISGEQGAGKTTVACLLAKALREYERFDGTVTYREGGAEFSPTPDPCGVVEKDVLIEVESPHVTASRSR